MIGTYYRLLPVLTVLIGCLVGDCVFAGDPSAIRQHYLNSSGTTPHPPGLTSMWKGRNVSELVAALGEPDMILETTFRGVVVYGDSHSVMYVYRTGSGNYDAYVVEQDSGLILAYHRR